MFATPNTIQAGDGFYVSYNDVDGAIYGCTTTALVKGQMERFYILKGDHRAQYKPLVKQGFEACMTYFLEHQDEAHPMSDETPASIDSPQPVSVI